MSFIISDDPSALYIFTSCIIVFCTSITLVVVFVPKVRTLKRYPFNAGWLNNRGAGTILHGSACYFDPSYLERYPMMCLLWGFRDTIWKVHTGTPTWPQGGPNFKLLKSLSIWVSNESSWPEESENVNYFTIRYTLTPEKIPRRSHNPLGTSGFLRSSANVMQFFWTRRVRVRLAWRLV